MSEEKKETVAVSVLGREFTVTCSADEREALMQAARYVDARMQEGQRASRSAALERTAVMAALNIAHELLKLREQMGTVSGEWAKRVQALTDRVDEVLREELKEQAS